MTICIAVQKNSYSKDWPKVWNIYWNSKTIIRNGEEWSTWTQIKTISFVLFQIGSGIIVILLVIITATILFTWWSHPWSLSPWLLSTPLPPPNISSSFHSVKSSGPRMFPARGISRLLLLLFGTWWNCRRASNRSTYIPIATLEDNNPGHFAIFLYFIFQHLHTPCQLLVLTY